VNGDIVGHSEVAARLKAADSPYSPEFPSPVRAWLEYLEHPSAVSWYRAHNASVVHAYLARLDEAKLEPAAEQRFMRHVLIRLLCAQALVEAGRHVRWLGALSDPRGTFIPRLLRFDLLYPQRYPLPSSQSRAEEVARAAVEAAELAIWRPALALLFQHGARWLDMPEMCAMVHEGQLYYPELGPNRHSEPKLRAFLRMALS
jgi:hypothetical protein